MIQLQKHNAVLAGLLLTLGLNVTACSKHESAESKPTEEIAAQQGEIARANNPPPAASEPASPMPSPASATSATASTTTATATASSTTTTKTTSAPASTAKTTTASASGSTAAGEKLYASFCKNCHEGGLMGAPKLGNKDDWKPRIAQGRDTLHKHAVEGYTGKKGVMPPKGGSSASDDDVKAAVDYMVSKSS